jgi:hypothetical protein
MRPNFPVSRAACGGPAGSPSRPSSCISRVDQPRALSACQTGAGTAKFHTAVRQEAMLEKSRMDHEQNFCFSMSHSQRLVAPRLASPRLVAFAFAFAFAFASAFPRFARVSPLARLAGASCSRPSSAQTRTSRPRAPYRHEVSRTRIFACALCVYLRHRHTCARFACRAPRVLAPAWSVAQTFELRIELRADQ